MITSGSLTLPDLRNTEGGIIGFTNETAYSSYKFIFPENKGPDGSANSIQFSEIELFDVVPEPGSAALFLVGMAGLGFSRKRRD
jgi:hypothetical protein